MNNIFIVPLTNSNQLCLIDSEDIEIVSQWKWQINSDNYIQATNNCKLRLHRLVLKYYKRKHVHHKNELRWDNRKINLIKHSPGLHRHIHGNSWKNKTSKYRYIKKHRDEWVVELQKKGNHYYCGIYHNEDSAALIANVHARALWGENAYQNKIE